jgi:hypothetical protein
LSSAIVAKIFFELMYAVSPSPFSDQETLEGNQVSHFQTSFPMWIASVRGGLFLSKYDVSATWAAEEVSMENLSWFLRKSS